MSISVKEVNTKAVAYVLNSTESYKDLVNAINPSNFQFHLNEEEFKFVESVRIKFQSNFGSWLTVVSGDVGSETKFFFLISELSTNLKIANVEGLSNIEPNAGMITSLLAAKMLKLNLEDSELEVVNLFPTLEAKVSLSVGDFRKVLPRIFAFSCHINVDVKLMAGKLIFEALVGSKNRDSNEVSKLRNLIAKDFFCFPTDRILDFLSSDSVEKKFLSLYQILEYKFYFAYQLELRRFYGKQFDLKSLQAFGSSIEFWRVRERTSLRCLLNSIDIPKSVFQAFDISQYGGKAKKRLGEKIYCARNTVVHLSIENKEIAKINQNTILAMLDIIDLVYDRFNVDAKDWLTAIRPMMASGA